MSCTWATSLTEMAFKLEDSKIAAIRDWPTPRTLTELRSFLGLANYYRKFVRNFSTIAAPLRRLLKKEAIWQWDKDCTSALKKLKCALIEYPVLKVADPSLPFVVTTDASQYGIGAVLQQDDDNGYRPVEFMSERMPSKKGSYLDVRERTLRSQAGLRALEALPAWEALQGVFRPRDSYWLKTQANMTPKLTRWAAEIDQYDFELKLVKGKYNVVADALSRRSDYFGAIVHYLDIGSDLQERVRQVYAHDPIYSDLLKRVKEAPETEPHYRITEGLLFNKTDVVDRLCVPNSEEIRSLILGECHDTQGHFGWQETLANLMHAYIWPGMKVDCIEYGCAEDEAGAMASQQEDIHSLDDALAQVSSCLQQLEQRPVAAPDASSSNTSDRLEALEIDVGSLKDGVLLQQTATQQLEQRICTAATHSSLEPRETTPKFDGQEIFCDLTKTDLIPWFRKFELKLKLHHVSEHKHHAYLYSRSGGACQAWLDNLLSKDGVVAADLHTKISWDDLKVAWHKRFQVEPPEIKAMDKLMTFEQGTLSSVDWIAKCQRLTSVPDIQMGFKAVKHYISRSCPTLGNALTHVEDTLTTTAELFDKAAQIIVTNKEAKNLHRSSATSLSRDQHRPKVAVVAAATPTDQFSEAVSANDAATNLARPCLPMKGTDSQPPGMVAAPAKAEDAARRRQTPHLAPGPAQQLQPHGPTMVSPNWCTRRARDFALVYGVTTISTTQWAAHREAKANRETEHRRK
ncbi:hypothetical protein CBR_g55055 [Chara braunii]|uniref:Reverse transcriptase/retrotransposon-derived protein RNase H-like domain-containing protein n=1 Tax=Chara braunii TaxID=69332 RepID=A0A388MCJ5_CHABU|nr:hypothetical protein CBR_g55055 [Chara braunii]|eukprot:GBG92286.1 hypothetical protein CBR_g55055 [Chara braunii]